MDSSKLNFKEDMEIDHNNLHLELARSPQLFAKWSERLVDAQNERDRAKDRMELRYSELDMKIRASPSEFGFEEEPKERAIRSKILADEIYRGMQEDYNQKKYDVGKLKIAVKLFESRGRTLDRLTKLYLAKYYAEDYTPKTLTDEDTSNETSQSQASLNAHMQAIRTFGPRSPTIKK